MTRFLPRVVRVGVVCALLSAMVAAQARTQPPPDPDAVFNVQSKIYHRASCSAARRCTKNCIIIKLSEAKKRGGRPCQICDGPSTQASAPSREGEPWTALEADRSAELLAVETHLSELH
jgi:methylphosphotriester-DNA--protein-cysteine methyltransferase